VPDFHRFYAPSLNANGPEVELPEEEAHHALKVLRLQGGETVEVFNGLGLLVSGQLESTSSKRAKVVAHHTLAVPTQGQPTLTLYLAPTKGTDRLEWMLEKAVELGLRSVQFIETARTERNKLRLDRLEKVAVSALKQSKRIYMPTLKPMVPFAQALAEHAGSGYLGWLPSTDAPPLLWDIWNPKEALSVWIGPEGDFTPQEASQALQKGIQPVHLGEARLRTETAALLAVSAYFIGSQSPVVR
jgi:16S rRNA (uracil1498-N3)-methyltransferase